MGFREELVGEYGPRGIAGYRYYWVCTGMNCNYKVEG